MATLILSDCVFLHVPKTGGTWALSALRRQGIVLATLQDPNGSDHPDLATVRSVIPDKPAIAAVREPVSWLRSFWRFFYRRNWRPSSQGNVPGMEPLLAMAAPTFAEFAQRYLSRRPGYISELMRSYAEGAEHVCRQEHLVDDLLMALVACGQDHLPDVIRATPRENVSQPFAAECPAEVEAKIRESDAWILETFYA